MKLETIALSGILLLNSGCAFMKNTFNYQPKNEKEKQEIDKLEQENMRGSSYMHFYNPYTNIIKSYEGVK